MKPETFAHFVSSVLYEKRYNRRNDDNLCRCFAHTAFGSCIRHSRERGRTCHSPLSCDFQRVKLFLCPQPVTGPHGTAPRPRSLPLRNPDV